jgi:hypothetical protein
MRSVTFNQATPELIESMAAVSGPIAAPELWGSLEATPVADALLPHRVCLSS